MDTPNEMTDAILKFINSYNAANLSINDCDYVGADGLLRCGICGEPKETIRELQTPDGVVEKKVFRCCSCEREIREKKVKERAKEDAMRKAASLRRASIMDARLYDARFDTCELNDANRKNIAACKRYAEKFDELMAKNQGLLFWGAVGTGKSYAAACIVNYLLDNGVSAVMTSFVKIMNIGDDTERGSLIRKLMTCKLAVLDDLGAERNNTFALEQVYDVVDARYRAKLPMIVTTNLALKDMLEEQQDCSKRIYDRIFEVCYPMQWTGPSWRRTQAKSRFDEMKELLGV